MNSLSILGIDTSNYTTSVAIVKDGNLVYDKRIILNVKTGEKGLRQSEALFQHVENLPFLVKGDFSHIKGVCVSTKPRPQEGSYMPVFKAGYSFAKCIAEVLNVPLIETSHQEGHIEAGLTSIGFNWEKFIAIHMSGGTSEVLLVNKRGSIYSIDIIGGSLDISFGQFIDRAGVAMGMDFPCGEEVDRIALEGIDKGLKLRIPSCVKGLNFNLSGQETKCLNLIKNGYNQDEIVNAVMLCIGKTLEKIFDKIEEEYNLPILLIGGVASSRFLRAYFKNNSNIYFTEPSHGRDNAIGVAYIGYNNLLGV